MSDLLRLTLTADDVVLVVMPVAYACAIAEGSTRGHHCDECGIECWRHQVAALVDDAGQLRRPPLVTPAITVLLCPACAAAHHLGIGKVM